MSNQSWAQTRDYLYALRNIGSRFGIERMERLAATLGQPQHRFPVIHVAGTNGKGSVCAMLEAVYRQAGYRTGLSSSPHLAHLGERVQVNRQILSYAQMIDYTERLRPLARQQALEDPELHPTFFEFLTAMAFLRFAEAEVDVALIETGLGGRLDATNVVLPEVSVITSIGLDHQNILGETIEAIAAEKGGIIKPGRPVVLGVLPAAAEAVLRQIAKERSSVVYSVCERFKLRPSALSPSDYENLPQTNLSGDCQRINAATATLVVETLQSRFKVADEALEQGLKSVAWPGRWERIPLPDDRLLILDATHNEEALKYLDRQLKSLSRQGVGPLSIVTSVLGMERARVIIPVLANYAAEIYLVKSKQPRACSIEDLSSCIPASYTGSIVRCDELPDWIKRAQTDSLPKGIQGCVVTGSLYLVGEVIECFNQVSAESTLQDRF